VFKNDFTNYQISNFNIAYAKPQNIVSLCEDSSTNTHRHTKNTTGDTINVSQNSNISHGNTNINIAFMNIQGLLSSVNDLNIWLHVKILMYCYLQNIF
jgi:hypothetical protein